jgi:ribosomal protein L21E
MIKLSTYLRQYKVGDIVDIKANGAVQKGSVITKFRWIRDGKAGRSETGF